MVDEIIWEKDYTPEIARKWSSDGRYEYVHKKYYIKCYFKIGGNKKETRHKYLCDESDETIDHYDHSDTDIKVKIGNLIINIIENMNLKNIKEQLLF